MEKQPYVRTGQTTGAEVVRPSSSHHPPAAVKSAVYGTESGAGDELVRARCLLYGSPGLSLEGVDDAFPALARPSSRDAGQAIARRLSSNSEGEQPSNSPGAKGDFGTIMDETPSVTVIGKDDVGKPRRGKPRRGTPRRRRGGSE